ncbi:MAG: GGDEF domain-containing protein [Armatimonadota bacterium]
MATPPPRWHWALVIALGLGIGTFVSLYWLPPVTARLVSCAAACLALLLGIVWLLKATLSLQLRRERRSWVFILFGAGVLLLQTIFWGLALLSLPSVRSVLLEGFLFLFASLCLWIGLAKRCGRPNTVLGLLTLLCDLLIAAGSAMLIWIILFRPALTAALQGASTVRIISVEFPLLSLVTLLLTLAMLSQAIPRSFHGPRNVLAAGVFLLIGGDIAFSIQYLGSADMPAMSRVLHYWGVPQTARMLGSLGVMFFGVAALWESALMQNRQQRSQVVDPFPSMLGVLATLALLFISTVLAIQRCLLTHPPLDAERARLILISLSVLVSLVVLRQLIAFITNRRLYFEMQHLAAEMARNAATDPVTNLPNHRYFMERFTKEVRRATRYERPLALIFADLDHFKRVNDTYGHSAGDRALQATADCLQRGLRDTDILARYGGEEFVVLLPETTLDQATALAERLRQAVEALRVPLKTGQCLNFTLSLGVSSYPTTSHSRESLLSAADKAMYRAKDEGRNRVGVAGTAEGESVGVER